jgi:hypothetical protein
LLCRDKKIEWTTIAAHGCVAVFFLKKITKVAFIVSYILWASFYKAHAFVIVDPLPPKVKERTEKQFPIRTMKHRRKRIPPRNKKNQIK